MERDALFLCKMRQAIEGRQLATHRARRPDTTGEKLVTMFDYYRDQDNRISLEELNGALDDDPLDMPTVRAEAGVVLDALADELDDRGRATLSAIRTLGGLAFKRNGTLNVNRIAQMTGQPQRTLARRVDKLKRTSMSLSI